MLAKSIDPLLAEPLPFIVCASSINRIDFFLVFNASNTCLTFSSKSPRYLDPASNAPTSSEYTSWLRINSGQSPSEIICARPSAIAVLPTPGSPTINTLLLKRLARTFTISSSSLVRPMSGSNLPDRARSDKLVVYSSNISSA